MRMLRLKDVTERTGLPRSTIYRKVQEGKFPKPVKLSEKIVAWPDEQIDSWIKDKIAKATS